MLRGDGSGSQVLERKHRRGQAHPRPRRVLVLLATIAIVGLAGLADKRSAAAQSDAGQPSPAACAPESAAGTPQAGPTLLQREPLGFDAESVGRLRDLVVSTSKDVRGILLRIRERGREVGPTGTALLM